ncbi:MAG: zinc-binding alcohol dehydrogenase family protein [Spirosomataceae bacterium]
MKAIILNKPGELELTERANLDEIRDGQAIVKIKRIGICGTDYHAFKGNQPFFSYPRVLGHELGAEVVALGGSLANAALKIGDKVAVEPYIHCRQCQACKEGYINCCENLQVLGVHTDGGMTEYLAIPFEKLHPSAQLGFDELALVETLGIGLHGVNRAQIIPNDKVLVIGAGPIGLSAAQFSQIKGATVAVADRVESRLAFVKENKLAHQFILTEAELTAELVRTYFEGQLPTVIIDATGNKESMQNAFQLIAHGGKIVYLGLFQGEVTFNDPNFHRTEISLLASRNALPADFRTIIALMESKQIDTQPWLSHRTRFDALPTIFKTLLNPEEKVIKAIVEM